MLVILKENIENVGYVGDLVKVSAGYARNFLIPSGKGAIADEGNVAAIEHQKKMLEKKRKEIRAEAESLAQKLSQVTLTFKRKVGKDEKLFGSVSSGDIADELKKSGFEIERRSVQLEDNLKVLGAHDVSVKLTPEVVATFKVWVTKEEA